MTSGARAAGRRWSGRRVAALVLLLAAPAAGRASDLDDPLPIRSQLPFHLLFLDQTPAAASILPRGAARIEVSAAYESTLAATGDLIRVLRADTTGMYGGRVSQDLLEMVAAGTPGQTAFVLDGETLRALVRAAWGAATGLELGVEVPLLRHGAGVMDSAIDWYHARFNFPDGGRPAFRRDLYQAGYVGDGESFLLTRGSSGIGDVVLSAKGSLLKDRRSEPWLSGSIAVKLPTGDPDRLLGSGSADVGARLHLSRRFGRTRLHGGYGWTAPGTWDLAPGLPIRNTRSAFAAVLFSPRPRTALALQILRSSGPLPYRPGTDLGRATMEIAAGIRHRRPGGLLIEAAFLENLNRDYNAPDVGFYFGIVLPDPFRSGTGSAP